MGKHRRRKKTIQTSEPKLVSQQQRGVRDSTYKGKRRFRDGSGWGAHRCPLVSSEGASLITGLEKRTWLKSLAELVQKKKNQEGLGLLDRNAGEMSKWLASANWKGRRVSPRPGVLSSIEVGWLQKKKGGSNSNRQAWLGAANLGGA